MKTYAVVEVGGNQFSVQKNDVIEANKIDHKIGHELKIHNVLMLMDGKSVEVGSPYLKNVTVVAEIVKQKRAPKVIAFKYKSKKSSRKIKGHRQYLTVLKIKDIEIK